MSHSAFLVRVTNFTVEENSIANFIISTFHFSGEVRQVQDGDTPRRGGLLLCQAKLPRPLQPRVQWRVHSEVGIRPHITRGQIISKFKNKYFQLAVNIWRKEARRNGLGERMGAAFLPLARDLGYSASFFNLVFVSNGVR